VDYYKINEHFQQFFVTRVQQHEYNKMHWCDDDLLHEVWDEFVLSGLPVERFLNMFKRRTNLSELKFLRMLVLH
jgi:hypothetical protein